MRTIEGLALQVAGARLIAGLTLREALRQRLALGLALAAAGLIASVQGLRAFNFGTTELRFVLDLGFGAIGLLGVVLTIALTTVLFFNEIEQRTLHTVLARPIERGTFLAGKWCGVAALLGLYCAVLTTALLALIAWRGDAGVRALDVVAAGFLQAVKLGVLASLVLVLATICRTALLTVILSFLLLAICQLQPMLSEVAVRTALPVGQILATGVVACIPDFQAFDVTAVLASGEPLEWRRAGGLVVYGVGYVFAAWALATVIFSRREL